MSNIVSKQLANRLKEVLTEGNWVTGTNIKVQIISIPYNEAIKEIHGLNSIAKLTFHIQYYISGVLKVLKGGDLTINDKHSFDSPPINSDEDWQQLIQQYIKDAEHFIVAVENLPDEKFQEKFVKEEYGNYERNINVLIEHSYYHFGQILLIKKILKLS